MDPSQICMRGLQNVTSPAIPGRLGGWDTNIQNVADPPLVGVGWNFVAREIHSR